MTIINLKLILNKQEISPLLSKNNKKQKGEYIVAINKTVRFDYFRVLSRSFNPERNVVEERPCDLTDVFTYLKTVPVIERVYDVGSDEARLQDIKFNNDKWELHFIRIRKNGFPIVTHDDGTYTYLDNLEDEEGLGEEVSVIYDPKNFVLMIRRNIHSLAPTAISSYLTSVINRIGYSIIFQPLIHPKSKELLQKEHLIRGAEISISDLKNSRSAKKSLGQIVKGIEDLNESVSIYLKIGIQPKGSKKTSRLPIYEELQGLIEDPAIESLKVRKKADEDAKVEYIDLIKHRLIDYHTFKETDFHEKSRNILHSTVIGTMHMYYRRRENEINDVYLK